MGFLAVGSRVFAVSRTWSGSPSRRDDHQRERNDQPGWGE
jgi:hypothetical protein